MARSAASANVRTYVPERDEEALILDFNRALNDARGEAPENRPALVSADGARFELPDAVYDVLRQVAEALSNGMGVTVAPMNAMLTTQEAAEFLGISRPTLVRILERGELPMEKPGRHRFVRLAALVEYQIRQRERTAAALDDMVGDGEEHELYAVTDGPPPATR